MKVSGAHHTSYTVSNIERSLEFYRDLLGCEIIWERKIADKYFRDIVAFPDSVVKAVELRIPGSDHILELFEYAHPRGQTVDLSTNNPGNSHVAFIVDDLQAAYEELSAKGVHFKSPPVKVDVGGSAGSWGAYVVDPDGITMELFQPAPQ
jgi:lactoylglutathione lyase